MQGGFQQPRRYVVSRADVVDQRRGARNVAFNVEHVAGQTHQRRHVLRLQGQSLFQGTPPFAAARPAQGGKIAQHIGAQQMQPAIKWP